MDAGLGLAALGSLGGVAVLRWSWSLARRSTLANLAGWGLLAASLGLAAGIAGAWGVSVVALVGMTGAAALLGWAAATSPKGRAKASDRRVRMLPEAGEPARPGGRVLTFAMVVLAGLAASIALAIALRGAALGVGWSEADANASALFAVPLAWGVLASVLLLLDSRRQQVTALIVTALPLVPALLAGS